MLTVEQALAYYSQLLIIQYSGLPKASATIETLANCSVCDGFFFQLQDCFDLTTAIGEQLTILGNIVGVPRNVYGLDLADTFFTFSNWNGQPASVGFNSWTTPVDADKIATWQSTAIYTPTDFEMLALIQLKIIANNAYESLGIVKEMLWNAFPNYVYPAMLYNQPGNQTTAKFSYAGSLTINKVDVQIRYAASNNWYRITTNYSFINNGDGTYTISFPQASYGSQIVARVAYAPGPIDIVDNFNSSITYNFQNPYHNVGAVCQYLGNIVAKPMGISISYNNI